MVAGGKDADIVSLPDSGWTILETQPIETQAWNWGDVASAWSGCTCDDTGLFRHIELSEEAVGLGERSLPSSRTGDVRYSVRQLGRFN